ncbi:MAG: hypothetical protein ACOYJ1_07210 [Peptococcales bacterium]|jgi:hypothetical protein
MADNVAGQYGYGGGFYGYQWLIWIAIIALVIYLLWFGGGCCR